MPLVPATTPIKRVNHGRRGTAGLRTFAGLRGLVGPNASKAPGIKYVKRCPASASSQTRSYGA